MTDDIIDRLRCAYRKGEEPPCEACTFCAARAEIERLRTEFSAVLGDAIAKDAENERLRAAGDALADDVDVALHSYSVGIYHTLAAWREARRG